MSTARKHAGHDQFRFATRTGMISRCADVIITSSMIRVVNLLGELDFGMVANRVHGDPRVTIRNRGAVLEGTVTWRTWKLESKEHIVSDLVTPKASVWFSPRKTRQTYLGNWLQQSSDLQRSLERRVRGGDRHRPATGMLPTRRSAKRILKSRTDRGRATVAAPHQFQTSGPDRVTVLLTAVPHHTPSPGSPAD